jgi:sortase B
MTTPTISAICIMGSITITGRCSLTTETGGDFTDTNTVIYGHHMRDRSMFGSLEEYRSQEFYDTFPTMTLYTPEGDYLIEFISGTIEDGNYEFIEFEFENDEAYMAYLADLRERSLFQSDVEVGPWDKIITLCTCSNNYMNARFMLVGKMVELYSTAE